MQLGKVVFGSRVRPPADVAVDIGAPLLAAREALRREYANGLRDGIRIALELSLGRESSAGEPFRGSRLAEFDVWAEAALERLSTEGGS